MKTLRARRPSVDKRDLQQVEHEVARILAETEQPVEVYAAALAAIGRCLDWELGSVWEADPKGERLHCVKTWHAGVVVTEFEALSERLELGLGEGLPGRVLLTGEPMWLVDAPTDGNFPRGGAAHRAACRLRLSAAEPARPRRRDGVLLARAARAGRGAPAHDARRRQPGRAVR